MVLDSANLIARQHSLVPVVCVFGVAMIIKLHLQRPLVLLTVGPMTGTLRPETNIGACGASGFNRDVGKPFCNANNRLLHQRFFRSGNSATFGVTRGLMAVGPPWSSITFEISP
jgi:hypothetical protein